MKNLVAVFVFFASLSASALTVIPLSQAEAEKQGFFEELSAQRSLERKIGAQECFVHYRKGDVLMIYGSKKRTDMYMLPICVPVKQIPST